MKNVLIVEDDIKFQDIYKEYAEGMGANVIIAPTLKDAENYIVTHIFDLALIDISLDTNDDKNVDGLLVLERLNDKDDGTHSIVITGQGTLKIARDAILRYGAVDAIDKNDLTIDYFEKILHDHLLKGAEATTQKTNMDWCSFKPDSLNFMQWENALLITCKSAGITPIHNLFDNIVKEFSPLLPLNKKAPLKIDSDTGICIGTFWSRRHGCSVIIVLANTARQDNVEKSSAVNIRNLIYHKQNKNVFTRVYKSADFPIIDFI